MCLLLEILDSADFIEGLLATYIFSQENSFLIVRFLSSENEKVIEDVRLC